MSICVVLKCCTVDIVDIGYMVEGLRDGGTEGRADRVHYLGNQVPTYLGTYLA